MGFKFCFFLIPREEERQCLWQLWSLQGSPQKIRPSPLPRHLPHGTEDWLGSKSFWCSSFPQPVFRGTARWWPCLYTGVVGVLFAAGWWRCLCSSAQMLPWDSWGCPTLCALSLCLSFSSCHWSLSRGAGPCLELLGSGSSPQGSSASIQPCTALLLLCPSCSVKLTTSSVNGWIHTAPPAHEAISWLPDLPLCKGSFASASSWSSPSCSGNAPPRAPASKKAAGAPCSLHITLTDENQLTGL